MWNLVSETVRKYNPKTDLSRNYARDCITAYFFSTRALSNIDKYLANYNDTKNSMDFYVNHVFSLSLGYYSDKPGLSEKSLKDIKNMMDLSSAFHKLDNLVFYNKISKKDCGNKMKAVLSMIVMGLENILIEEINSWDIKDSLLKVEDKRSYLINFLELDDDPRYDKLSLLINFIDKKFN
jgi:hypothetical protein